MIFYVWIQNKNFKRQHLSSTFLLLYIPVHAVISKQKESWGLPHLRYLPCSFLSWYRYVLHTQSRCRSLEDINIFEHEHIEQILFIQSAEQLLDLIFKSFEQFIWLKRLRTSDIQKIWFSHDLKALTIQLLRYLFMHNVLRICNMHENGTFKNNLIPLSNICCWITGWHSIIA